MEQELKWKTSSCTVIIATCYVCVNKFFWDGQHFIFLTIIYKTGFMLDSFAWLSANVSVPSMFKVG